MKKDKATKKWLKALNNQLEGATDGLRYTMDFMSGTVTPVTKKKSKKHKHKDKASEESQTQDEDQEQASDSVEK